MPHAFTEQGVAMLSGILNSDRAIAVNIQIMRTFTKLRHMISEKQKNYLLEVTTFNIRTRYPDYKFKFHKKATKEFTRQHITAIKELRQWLLKKIKS